MEEKTIIDLEQFAKEYNKQIKNACEIANSLRPHMLGGATKREIAIRTGWTMDQVEKCVKLLKQFKVISIFKAKTTLSDEKYIIDFEPENILPKIERERGFFYQRLFELDLLQKYFIPTVNTDSTSSKIVDASEQKK